MPHVIPASPIMHLPVHCFQFGLLGTALLWTLFSISPGTYNRALFCHIYTGVELLGYRLCVSSVLLGNFQLFPKLVILIVHSHQ